MIWLLAAALLVPLAAVALVALRRAWRVRLPALMPWAALPGLTLAVLAAPGLALDLPWLLTGLRLELDGTGRAFLLFTALLWLLAGVYARGYLAADAHAPRFAAFFIATCAGNFGLILAADVIGFYLFYALMTFAAYGLIVHDGTAAARRAGQVYIVMAILGEALLLVGFLLLVQRSGGLLIAPAVAALAALPGRDTVIALLLAGFGIKAGALLLHMWLPLAHPVAPTPASAVLSGAMIKAGLLGWLRFLPLGATASDAGWLVLGAGLAAAFYGVAVGLVQRDAKVILAYSSISQMGLMSIGVGLGLLAPEVWSLLLPALIGYAIHHGLTKGALFLGAGVLLCARGAHRGAVIGLALLGLALAGAPFTSGAIAKQLLTDAALASPWGGMLLPWLALAAVATTLLMLRLLWCVTRGDAAPRHALPRIAQVGWWLALGAALSVPLWLPSIGVAAHAASLSVAALWSAAWPVLGGVLLAAAARAMQLRRGRRLPAIAPGDVLWPLLRAGAAVGRYTQTLRDGRRTAAAPHADAGPRPRRPRAARLEKQLSGSALNGALAVLCLAALVALLALG